ncbi:MAG TPA: hypothetical protein VNK46_00395 [Nitrospiraceae bacterium]|jgi:hypothetical protein|nr:hypothetical protein [Nitrospiraceae bacterium]
MSELWREAMVEAFRDTMKRIALFLPNLLAMISLVAAGLAAAWLAKVVLLRLLRAVRFDSLCERWGLTASLIKAGIGQSPAHLVGRLAFWMIFLLFAFMGLGALQLPASTSLMNVIFGFLPSLLAALFLLLFGLLLANFFAEAALIAAVNAQIREARLIANLIRWGIMIFTAAMVLTQLGIAKEIVVAAFSITFGGVVLALAIALGLGGRNIAKEALERRLRDAREREEDISHL